MSRPSSAYPELPWVMTLFAPPALRVNGEEYRQVLWDATLRQQLPPLYVVVPLKPLPRGPRPGLSAGLGAAWLAALRPLGALRLEDGRHHRH